MSKEKIDIPSKPKPPIGTEIVSDIRSAKASDIVFTIFNQRTGGL